jgi:hypothetical protein
MSEEHKHEKEYFFFVGTTKYETDLEVVSGAYVKSRIENLPPGSGLELEGEGHEPNRPFSDTDTVSLKVGHGEGPRRFTIVPPANFG